MADSEHTPTSADGKPPEPDEDGSDWDAARWAAFTEDPGRWPGLPPGTTRHRDR